MINNFFQFFTLATIPLMGFYCEHFDYIENTREHRQCFSEMLKQKRCTGIYERVLLGLSCDDCDYIPKHKDAGKVFIDTPIPYQVMHNGIKVTKGGYNGGWMEDLIFGLHGHHEPQEEKAFYEVLKHIPKNATMVELGSSWGYYSLWFNQTIENSINFLVEPDIRGINLGKQNFLLNNTSATFFRGHIGTCGVDAGNHDGSKQIFIDQYLKENNIEKVHILHSDIQGSELLMLKSACKYMQEDRIDYFFVSTHSESLHENCLLYLKKLNYKILGEHSPKESYSCDGLIVAKRKGLEGLEAIALSKHR